MATKHGFPERSDVRDPFVQSKDDRKTTEYNDQNSQNYQPPNVYRGVLVVKRREWHPCALDRELRALNGKHYKILTMKTNIATLKSRSSTAENTESAVCLLKCESQANATPEKNAAKRSSEPSKAVIPLESRAKLMY
jgi:hypothetical protein